MPIAAGESRHAAGFEVTMFHNPACETSRQVLARLRKDGLTVNVVEYLGVEWDPALLWDLIAAIGLGARRAAEQRKHRYARRSCWNAA